MKINLIRFEDFLLTKYTYTIVCCCFFRFQGECCGSNGPDDYIISAWKNTSNDNDVRKTIFDNFLQNHYTCLLDSLN